MRLSELMSQLSPTQLTEIALVIFLVVFVLQALRALRRSARPLHDQAAVLPLADDAPTYQRGGGRS